MRVVLVSPPKSGASRLRCLLATAYELRAVDARDAPVSGQWEDVADWLAHLPDYSVTHSGLPFHPLLAASAVDFGVNFVAVVRHPFDLFVSNREVRHNRAQRATHRTRVRGGAPGDHDSTSPISQDDSLETFADELNAMHAWAASAPTARYEDILGSADAVLTSLTGALGALDEARIATAVKLCPPEQRIISSGNRGVRMAEIPPGSWRTGIEPATLEQLLQHFAESVVSLGYDLSLSS